MHACIDLGSNSFHLLIGEWKQGKIEIVERLSEKVQLGENVRQTGRISPAAFERGLACLRRFATTSIPAGAHRRRRRNSATTLHL